MNTKFIRTVALLALSIHSAAAFSIELNGAGRRIPAPIFELWSKHYAQLRPGVTVKYQAVSASEGFKQLSSGQADFGETDHPLSKEELDKLDLAQFPYMFSAITPVVNLPGVEGQINLTGKILGDIYLGKITKWNDRELVNFNPRAKLPNEKILVAHLVPERGGTYNLSSYLSKTNPEWASKVGVGVSLKWPVGTAVENLYAMGDYVKKTPYSIGYSENSYARKNQLTLVKLQNSSGRFISPHIGSIEEATRDIKWKAANGFREDLIDSSSPGAWPITSASYFLIRKTSDNIERRVALLGFVGWGLNRGDMDVTSLDFLPVPRSLTPIIRNSWNDTPLVIEGANVVSAAQVRAFQASGIPIIDTRVASEYNAEHIAGAINVTYFEKSAKSAIFSPHNDKFDLSKLPANKNADIVIYCNAGACWRSYKAAVAAIKAGYKKVHWFRGGMPEWTEKNYPTEAGFSETAKK